MAGHAGRNRQRAKSGPVARLQRPTYAERFDIQDEFPDRNACFLYRPLRAPHAGRRYHHGHAPGGGLGMKPPIFLKAGDMVELGIDGLGTQRQIVTASGT